MKKIAIVFGIVMLAVGIAGFVPALCPDGKLLGLFAVDAMHNVVHLVTGVAAIGLGFAGDGPARMFFRVFGVVYGLVALLGFVAGGDGHVLGMSMNMADHVLHVGISALSLWLGFAWHPGSLPPDRGHDRTLRGA